MADGCGAWHWPAKEVRKRRACMCSSAVTLWHCMEACHALGRVRRGAEAVERTEETARLNQKSPKFYDFRSFGWAPRSLKQLVEPVPTGADRARATKAAWSDVSGAVAPAKSTAGTAPSRPAHACPSPGKKPVRLHRTQHPKARRGGPSRRNPPAACFLKQNCKL